MERHIKIEALPELRSSLRAGDKVYLTGTVYTSRDAAHKKIMELLDRGQELPYPLRSSVIYYAGPTPAQKGMAVGSCGPTTSGRMDPYTPRLLDLGLTAMIGKGERNDAVVDAIRRNGAVYFCAVGGAGALMACCIKSAREIAFPELGCESVKEFVVEELPVYVAVDCLGNSVFRTGKEAYRR